MRKVYITGVGFITSIGNEAVSVSESLRELRHGMIQYPPFQKADVPVKVAAVPCSVPPLTTVDFDRREFVESALDLLGDRMTTKDAPPRRIVIPHRIVPRASTAR